MGASGWEYVTPYEGSVEKSLAALQDRLFAEEWGDDFGSIAEMWADEEFMGTAGTHSVLDIPRVVHTTAEPEYLNDDDYGTLRPMAAERILHHFGTERPTPARFEQALAEARAAWRALSGGSGPATLLAESSMRWTGRYVLLYAEESGDEPSHVGIFGSSGD
ncbi:hypothetical protein [Streptomyces sp. NRRL F-5123]|uniref:hypothetical protein n=1 Tax=Streptomyces sp. NRRL F-5123 TaxID=1463856 RepID=UPI0004E0D3F0|nr:hypothetical protein [Streptomyces sp. NRRL F-5123]